MDGICGRYRSSHEEERGDPIAASEQSAPEDQVHHGSRKKWVSSFQDVCFTRQLDGSLTREVYQKQTHTNRYVLFNSHHPENVKVGIVQGLADRTIKVCNDTETRYREFRCISAPMECNGYPKRFMEKAISKQLKRGTTSRAERLVKEADQANLEKASIPYVEASAKRYIG